MRSPIFSLCLPKKRRENIEKAFSFEIPGVIVSHSLDVPRELIQIAEKKEIPIVRVSSPTSDCFRKISEALEEKLAPSISVHGVCVEVFGIGVLILGKSGIGKSECALELLERGHRLIADDVVDIRKLPGSQLMAQGAHLIKHHMEIRGIGIINVRSIFGVKAIRDKQRVDLIVDLEIWEEGKEYDRLGLEDTFETIMNVKVPRILIPVRPGRNIAVIIEAAALNQRLKMMGYHAAQRFNDKLIEWIRNEEKKLSFDDDLI